MGWLIALGILLLLAYLPLGVALRYDSDGPLVRVIAGPLRIQIFPRKKKNKDKVKKKAKGKKVDPKAAEPSAESSASAHTETPKESAAEKEKKGGSVTDFLPLVRVALNFLGEFRRKLRINRLELNLIMAGGDPCDIATN